MEIRIGRRAVGDGHPVFLVAELSGNHGGSIDRALALVEAAKSAGADAVKLQTYTADTLTIESDREPFRIKGGTLWDGKTLHALYREAYTPWEWQPRLFERIRALGMEAFSTAFDETAVDFLEKLGVAVHKVASFESVDLALISRMARTGKPLVISTGMAAPEEIADAVRAAREGGAAGVALLRCVSSYPAPPEEMDLRTIPDLRERFGCPAGLSDHTLGAAVPVAAVALGACMIEKHFTMSRSDPGPDAAFSMEPAEFKAMADAVRTAEKALGRVRYGCSPAEAKSRIFRRSLFVVRDVKAGEPFTRENVRSIRPGDGLAPKHLDAVLGRRASRDVARGTPLSWDLM